jgi:hypothetical protein
MEIANVPSRLWYHTDDSMWRLLRDADDLYILVHCEASFASYDRLVKLDAAELRDFQGLGWLSLQHLANRINYFADEYKGRSLTGPTLTAAQHAVGLEQSALPDNSSKR